MPSKFFFCTLNLCILYMLPYQDYHVRHMGYARGPTRSLNSFYHMDALGLEEQAPPF